MFEPPPGRRESALATHSLPDLISAVGDGSSQRAVVLTGGGSMLANLAPRLNQELSHRLADFKGLVLPPHRDIGVWKGAAVMASVTASTRSTRDGPRCQWIRKEDYDEFGPACVHRR